MIVDAVIFLVDTLIMVCAIKSAYLIKCRVMHFQKYLIANKATLELNKKRKLRYRGQICARVLRDKTIDDKLMCISNDDELNYPFYLDKDYWWKV